MKSLIKRSFVFVAVVFLSLNAFSAAKAQEAFVWNGVVKGSDLRHSTNHDHFLEFVRSEDQKVYDIVDSPDLVELHHNTNRNYRVEIEGVLTSKFLFWGGNLVVKKFKVLEELNAVPLKKPREVNVRVSDR